MSVNLVIIAIIVCNSFYFSTIKLQQFPLIIKFTDTYNSSNSREFSKMVPLFCQKYGLDNKWWCYPMAIWELECIFNSHIGEIDFAKCNMPDNNITYRVAIESSLDVNDFVSKKENRDYTKFRLRPLIRMDETRFFLFNHNLWIEHIYNSLILIFV